MFYIIIISIRDTIKSVNTCAHWYNIPFGMVYIAMLFLQVFCRSVSKSVAIKYLFFLLAVFLRAYIHYLNGLIALQIFFGQTLGVSGKLSKYRSSK
jgi:hypothetical protein